MFEGMRDLPRPNHTIWQVGRIVLVYSFCNGDLGGCLLSACNLLLSYTADAKSTEDSSTLQSESALSESDSDCEPRWQDIWNRQVVSSWLLSSQDPRARVASPMNLELSRRTHSYSHLMTGLMLKTAETHEWWLPVGCKFADGIPWRSSSCQEVSYPLRLPILARIICATLAC